MTSTTLKKLADHSRFTFRTFWKCVFIAIIDICAGIENQGHTSPGLEQHDRAVLRTISPAEAERLRNRVYRCKVKQDLHTTV